MCKSRFSKCSSMLVLAAALAIPALAAGQDNSNQNNAPVVLSYGLGRSQAPPRMMTAIGFTNASTGLQMQGFPCMGGAAGCADQVTGTIALSAPQAVIIKGSKVTYTFEFDDVSYTGPCSLDYVLTIGTTKVDSGHYDFASGCAPKTVYFAAFNRVFKTTKKNGVGQLNGALKAGTHTDTIIQKFCFM